VGAQVNVSAVRSKLYPDSRTIGPSLTAKRQLTAVWEIDGNVGVIFQHIAGPFPSSTQSLSYGVNACGTYPRTHICLGAQRQTSASGFGALRTNSGVNASLTEDLSEKSHLTLSASFYRSRSPASVIGIGQRISPDTNSRALIANAQYDRDFTRRLSGGFGGVYQWRDTARSGSGRAASATVHVTAKLGRL